MSLKERITKIAEGNRERNLSPFLNAAEALVAFRDGTPLQTLASGKRYRLSRQVVDWLAMANFKSSDYFDGDGGVNYKLLTENDAAILNTLMPLWAKRHNDGDTPIAGHVADPHTHGLQLGVLGFLVESGNDMAYRHDSTSNDTDEGVFAFSSKAGLTWWISLHKNFVEEIKDDED